MVLKLTPGDDGTAERRAELKMQIKAQEKVVIAMMKAGSFADMPTAQQRLAQLRLELRRLK